MSAPEQGAEKAGPCFLRGNAGAALRFGNAVHDLVGVLAASAPGGLGTGRALLGVAHGGFLLGLRHSVTDESCCESTGVEGASVQAV